MNDIFDKTFEIIKQELLNTLGKDYELELEKIFNLKVLEDDINIKFKQNSKELFSISIKKKDLLTLPEIIKNNVNTIKEKLEKELMRKRASFSSGDDGSEVITIQIELHLLIDEHNNFIVDEYNNYISF